ncbi:MAG: hypothetical protein LBT27_05460 [Prevotellaceae bacterium]|jgi:hypothetical protein|nr:hypothetical protein [Prevotellaceae bacterium]
MKNVGIQIGEEYDIAVKVRYDAAGKIISGFVIGDVTLQNQQCLLLAEKGEIKEYPLLGVGIKNYLDDDGVENLTRAIRTEFVKDGIKVNKISFENSNIKIDAKYD